MPTAACPDPNTLQRILLGLEDTIEDVIRHMETCADCGRRMRAIRAEDEVVEAMRASPVLAGAADSTQVRSLIPVLKCLRPRDGTVTQIAAPASSTFVGVTYSFLGPAANELELGTLGPYRILDVLGTGGMGVVFLAHDDRLNRRLAVKVIKPALTARADAVERFLNEARAVAAVEHDNIVPIYQADEYQGTPFLAMPLLHGESLETRLQREQGALPIADVLRIARDTALGLAAAHARALIHRDIKPGNLWLDSSAGDRVKILDFGLAAATKPGGGQAFDAAGTPAYMAPEQAVGAVLDGRADLFSLGCVLYRAATGRPAFKAAGVTATIESVANHHPPHPRELNPRLPRELGELIVALLAKRPDDRPATADEVAARIDRMLAPKRSWLARRGWVLFVGALALVVGIGIWRWPDQSPGPATVITRTPEAGPEVAPAPRPASVRELRKHQKHQSVVTAVALVEHEGRLLAVSASRDRRVWLWDLTKDETDENPWPLRPARDAFFDAPLLSLAVTADGKRVAVGGGDLTRGNRTRLWDVEKREEIPLPFGSQQGLIQAVAFVGDGPRFVQGGSDGLVSVWDTAKGKALGGYADRDPKRYNLGITAVAVAKSEEYALAGGGDGSVIVLGLDPIVARKTHYDVHKDGVSAVAILPDGRGFVSGGKDGVILVWDREGAPRPFLGHKGAVNSIAVSASGSRLVSAGEDGTLRVWDVARGAADYVASANAKAVEGEAVKSVPIKSVALTADGRSALTGGSDRDVRFWQLPSE